MYFLWMLTFSMLYAKGSSFFQIKNSFIFKSVIAEEKRTWPGVFYVFHVPLAHSH